MFTMNETQTESQKSNNPRPKGNGTKMTLKQLLTNSDTESTISCGLLVWTLNPFRSCIDNHLTDEVIQWLRIHMARVPSDMSVFYQEGEWAGFI